MVKIKLERRNLFYLYKLIYIRIVVFCGNDKYNNTYFDSNGYFANLFRVKLKAISVIINEMFE
ncbi:unknown [Clostridium sp. CAG:1193]|nr:unknown [Clostridium sp. CAG:1193]